jgi:hypothetical protein
LSKNPATATLVLPAGLAAALEELCTLAAYHPDGFTYTPQMEAACQHIADKSRKQRRSVRRIPAFCPPNPKHFVLFFRLTKHQFCEGSGAGLARLGGFVHEI